MNDTAAAKAEAEKIWNSCKPAIEALTTAISTLYESAGSPRKCRSINQLWQANSPGVGLGFVPPEVKEKLENLITLSGLHLAKGNGPLGHGAYFSLVYDSQFDIGRIGRLTDAIGVETEKFRAEPPPVKVEDKPAEVLLEEQVKRVEGAPGGAKDITKTVPNDVKMLVEAFNATVVECDTAKALKLFAAAVPFFNLPEISRNELLHTIRMMQDAESIGA